MANGQYQIVEAQLPLPNSGPLQGIAGHNFLVLVDPDGNVLSEIDGLATRTGADGKQIQVEVGFLPSDKLQGLISPGGDFYKGNINDPNNPANTYAQQFIATGNQSSIMNMWNAATADTNAIRNPFMGLGPNNNSFASTLIQVMGLTETAIPGGAVLQPGQGVGMLLTPSEVQSIQQKYGIISTSGQINDDIIIGTRYATDRSGNITEFTSYESGNLDVQTNSGGIIKDTLYDKNGDLIGSISLNSDSIGSINVSASGTALADTVGANITIGAGSNVNVGGNNNAVTVTGNNSTVTLVSANSTLLANGQNDVVYSSGLNDTSTTTGAGSNTLVTGANSSAYSTGANGYVTLAGSDDQGSASGTGTSLVVAAGVTGDSLYLNGASEGGYDHGANSNIVGKGAADSAYSYGADDGILLNGASSIASDTGAGG